MNTYLVAPGTPSPYKQINCDADLFSQSSTSFSKACKLSSRHNRVLFIILGSRRKSLALSEGTAIRRLLGPRSWRATQHEKTTQHNIARDSTVCDTTHDEEHLSTQYKTFQ